jgi:DNA transformation protein and related proteins
MAKRAARPGTPLTGGFGAFLLDQLGGLGDVEAKPMFGGAGFYLDGTFFGILYKDRVYFRTSKETMADYAKRKMKPFTPFEGRRGGSKTYFEVPAEILESPDDFVSWARKAAAAATDQPTKKRPARPRRGAARAARAAKR